MHVSQQNIPLEDGFSDVISKAQRGIGMTDSELCRNAGISAEQLQAACGGTVDEEILRRLSGPLQLHPGALIRMTRNIPPAPISVEGLRQIVTPYAHPTFPDGSVNSYLVWDPESKQAVVFDTGTTIETVLEILSSEGLTLTRVLLTHTHPDHVAALDQLQERFPDIPVSVHSSERTSGMLSIDVGTSIALGNLSIEVRQTSGHSPGGLTYVINGLKRPVAIVGDALFARSAGGAPRNWESALQQIERNIFSLPDSTVVCPGHGPMTTVGEEKEHNPLFPAFK